MYAKVFASMWDGTLYGQWEAWSVFVFLLAHADPEGFVDMHPKAIAARSGLPIEAVEKGLEVLEAEDPESRTTEFEGRRLERIDAHRPWGWRIINYTKYRNLQDADSVRSQTRERVRRHREKKRYGNAVKRSVTDGNGSLRQAEVDAEAVSDAKASSCPTPSDDHLSVEDWTTEIFWPAYPRKEGKAKALKAMASVFKTVPRSREDALADQIMAGLLHHRARWSNPQFIPLPASWIAGRRWEDELESDS